MKLGETESDDLAKGILSLAEAIKSANTTAFAVFGGTVVVEFGMTSAGRLKVVVVGGERQTKGVHKMKLTFRPT